MSRRRKRSPYLLAGFLVGSAVAQLAIAALFDRLHEPPERPAPMLTIEFDGEGQGAVILHAMGRVWSAPCVSRDLPEWMFDGFCRQTPIADVTCATDSQAVCRYTYPRGHRITVEAVPAKGSYLDGWSSACMPGESFYRCSLISGDTDDLLVFYEKVPEDVDLEMVAVGDDEQPDHIDLPEPDAEIALLDAPVEIPPPVEMPEAPPEPEPDKLPIELPQPQVLEPPPPVIPQPQPPQPQPAPPPEPKKQPPKVQMKSVEVADDENIVKEAPKDAQFLSDKNRDVAEQTHARDTNLEKEQKGDGAYSEKSDIQAPEIGAEEQEIAQLEDSEASAFDAKETEDSTHDGKQEIARGIRVGDDGQTGTRGDGGDGGDGSQAGALAMRGVAGRGAPGGPVLPEAGDEPGAGGDKGRKGKPGRRGIKTDITFDDYERIVGTDKADDEVEIAKRTRSKKRGRWGKKIARVQSSLENFTPEIKPGNQTALKTRAEPFAVYVARMHRRIHELWGFGFLEELDGKATTHEMNDENLMTKIEVVINPDGTVDKATIVKHSGVLTFDVAALDTIFTAEPFESPPRDIRSPDGKVYLHWRFHRDWRQCGTFGVDKFIRSDAPAGADDGHDHDDEAGMFTNRRRKRREKAADKAAMDKAGEVDPAAAARAAANMPDPDDPAAEKAALAWMAAFEAGQIGELVNVTIVPFSSRGQVVANEPGSVAGVYGTVIKETESRRILDWKLLSPAGYRKLFDALPEGADAMTSVFLVVRVKGERFTLTLKRKADGSYGVAAFDR